MFAGKDLEQFLGYQPKNEQKVDWFTYIFKERFTKSDQFDIFALADESIEKEYDLVYFGDKRGSFRENQLRKYFPMDTNNLKIGYKSDKVPGEFMKKLKHEDLMAQLDKVKVSFIIEYDPEKKLIQDPVLRDLLYVSNQDDVRRLINAYSPDLINRQRKELRRIFNLKKVIV